MSSVHSSAQASCLAKYFGSEKWRMVDAHVAVFLWAIMQPPLEFVIEAGSRASEGVRIVYQQWSIVWMVVNMVTFIG